MILLTKFSLITPKYNVKGSSTVMLPIDLFHVNFDRSRLCTAGQINIQRLGNGKNIFVPAAAQIHDHCLNILQTYDHEQVNCLEIFQ